MKNINQWKEKVLEAIEISKICKENDVLFIVNDHVDIAIITNADGIHVGQDDIPVSIIRKLIGNDKIIGLSTHSQKKQKLLEKILITLGLAICFQQLQKIEKLLDLNILNIFKTI